jgi:hypothetical protein
LYGMVLRIFLGRYRVFGEGEKSLEGIRLLSV